MEKEKNNLWIIIVLVLIILGLAGYIVYDKVLFKEENNQTTIQEQTTDSNIGATSNIPQILETSIGNIIVDKTGNVYYEPSKKIKQFGVEKELVFVDNTKIGNYSKYEIDGDTTRDGSNRVVNGYKLDLENITAAYECYFGNGAMMDAILFTSTTGQVDVFAIYLKDDNKFEVKLTKNATDYKDIISVVPTNSGSAQGALLIDKSGNKYSFSYQY